jgi:hypothetical protein
MFVKGAGGWLYDFGPLNQAPDGWYASPPIIEEMARFARLGELRSRLDLGSVSEIAACADETTFTATQHWEAERPWSEFGIRYSDFFNHWFLNTQSRAIHRIGAPTDFLHQWDLDAEAPDRYRLFLMLNAFLLSETDVDRILSRLEGSGATVVWFYAPGFITPDRLDLAQMERLTGFRFRIMDRPGPFMIRTAIDSPELPAGLEFGVAAERSPRFEVMYGAERVFGFWQESDAVAFAARNMHGFRSVYVGTAPLPVEVLRWLAREAGARLWSNFPDIVYAGRDAAMVVANGTGKRELTWTQPMVSVEGGPSACEHVLDLDHGEVRIFARHKRLRDLKESPND